MSERNLTDADVQAIADALRCNDSLCRFHVDPVEFEEHWHNLKELSSNMNTAKKITTKLVITAIVLSVIGAIAAGLKDAILSALGSN